jgi:hypothetical protein
LVLGANRRHSTTSVRRPAPNVDHGRMQQH